MEFDNESLMNLNKHLADFEAQLAESKNQSNFLTSGEEILYQLLFSDETNQNDQKRQSLDESLAYLQELNSYHIDRLQAEPVLLSDTKQNIQEDIKNLAFSNYKTFIRTAQCSRDIYSDFSVIENKLDQLIVTLPEFGQMCDNFTKSIQNINASRRANNLTLQKHNQLLEILEISQLMDTCVRNEYYEEALDLASYVKRLEKKYAPSIPLIQQIVDDVNKSLNLMLKQLLQQLKTNLQFNQCLKIIGIIRRLDVFTESELRIKFLQLRDSWLQSLLQQIPQNDPYHHISKTIEENRIHLFDIITQYRAIFSDDDVLSSTTANSILNSSSQDKLISSLILNQKDLNESKLFYCWLQQKIKNFLNVLRKDLKLGVGNRLDSVLSQSMYFGLAFSRVGLDFRVLMVPIFEDAILDQVKKQLGNANTKFEEALNKVNWSELYLENFKSSTARVQTDYNLLDSKLKSASGSNSSIVNPPIQLLEFQPLAVYLNAILLCFNELRLCSPLSLYLEILTEIKSSFKKLAKFIKEYHKKEKLDKNENELFSTFVYQLAYVLIPFVEKCFLLLFSIEQLQKVYGIPQSDLNKLKQSIKIDARVLLEEIKELIPDAGKEEESVLTIVPELPVEQVENKESTSAEETEKTEGQENKEIENTEEKNEQDNNPILVET